MKYADFLESKRFTMPEAGFNVSELNENLSPFQQDIVRWALRKGKAAIFAGTGLGKTRMQAEWANRVHVHTDGNILILAPLAVASQTVREGQVVGIDIHLCSEQSDVRPGINIANYERLHKFDPNSFVGIVLDESSILKSYTGKIRNQIIDSFRKTPYRLACTATPAPNDYMELGNHSEFLGVMSRTEMLSMFFVHDGGETQKWRLKGHAEEKFWEWVASWSVMLQKPSDLGYEDGNYVLPPLNIIDHVVETKATADGYLFTVEAQTLLERQQARRDSIKQRVAKAAEIVNSTDRPFIVWCDLNVESELLVRSIPGAVEVKGSDSPEHKECAMIDFADGKVRVLVTKPSIAGFGMNWQHCSDMAFVGLTDSFEQVYQAIRRCYRFGQKRPVNVHMIVSDAEGSVAANIKRKEAEFEAMYAAMVRYTKDITRKNIRATTIEKTEYDPRVPMKIPDWLRGETA
jgi:hypothetical protein